MLPLAIIDDDWQTNVSLGRRGERPQRHGATSVSHAILEVSFVSETKTDGHAIGLDIEPGEALGVAMCQDTPAGILTPCPCENTCYATHLPRKNLRQGTLHVCT